MSPRVLAIVVLLLAATPSRDAAAQGGTSTTGDAGLAGEADLGDIEVDPVSGKRYRRVRPEGLERGLFPVDRWVPVAVAAVLAVLAATALYRAMRGKRS